MRLCDGCGARSQAPAGLRAIMLTARTVITGSWRWLSTSISERTTPRSGFEVEARLLHRDPHGQRVAGAHRLQPAQLVEAGRSQARRRRQVVQRVQPHHQAAGVPAAGDEAAERPARSDRRIGVDRLRIEAAREFEHLFFAHRCGAQFVHRSGHIVFEPALGHLSLLAVVGADAGAFVKRAQRRLVRLDVLRRHRLAAFVAGAGHAVEPAAAAGVAREFGGAGGVFEDHRQAPMNARPSVSRKSS